MQLRIGTIIIFALSSLNVVYAQTSTADSTFVKEENRNYKRVSFDTLQGDTINVVILINKQQVKYGKWVFRYSNGKIKSEGFVSLNGIIKCGTGNGPFVPHYFETRIGKWNYWDEIGNPRTDLNEDEQPSQGYYKYFDAKGRLYEEGEFGDAGKLINGKRYQYSQYGYLMNTDNIKNGKFD